VLECGLAAGSVLHRRALGLVGEDGRTIVPIDFECPAFEWTHIAIVADSDANVSIYANG